MGASKRSRMPRAKAALSFDKDNDAWRVKKADVGNAARDREERDNEFIDKLVHINRVAKVVKGGRRFGFAALVVVGDQRAASASAMARRAKCRKPSARRPKPPSESLIRIPLKDGRTLHHEVRGHHGAGKVIVRPAPAGTGIIAGGPMRAVFEALGVGDVVSKSLGTSNPYNMVRATFDALKNQQSPRMVAQRRGRSVAEILSRREGAGERRAGSCRD